MTTPDKTPDVKGDLQQYPFPRLLYYLYKKSFVGELCIDYAPNKQAHIFFRNGKPINTDLASPQDMLCQILLELAWISEEIYNKALEKIAQGKKPLGQILLELGALNEDKLIDALNIQLRRKLNRIFFLSDSPFAIYTGEHPYGVRGEERFISADPLWVIYNGVKNSFDIERVEKELSKLGNSPVQIRPEFEKIRNRYGMANEVIGLITTLMRGALPLEQIWRISNLGNLETKMLIYILWTTEALIIENTEPLQIEPLQTEPPRKQPIVPIVTPLPIAVPIEQTPPSKKAITSTEVQTLRHLITEKSKELEGKNYFEILGLDRNATKEQIHKEYFKMAKMFHPDRVTGFGLTDLTGKADEIFQRINEANSILTDPEKRKEYEYEIDHGGQNLARKALEAEFEFQQAMVFFRKRQYGEALKHFKDAFKLNPQEGEHLAWIAWTVFNDPTVDREKMLSPLKEQLLEAVNLSPKSADCNFFLGEVYLLLKEDKRALTCFNKALEINPQHVDAARQVRFIKMRREKETIQKKPTGLFGRFKKK